MTKKDAMFQWKERQQLEGESMYASPEAIAKSYA